jgi:SNF2 family DNA or RNA helicase
MATGTQPGSQAGQGIVKSVVYSQFTSMLHLVCAALRREGIPYVHVDGTMSEKKRAAAIEAFQSGVGANGEVPEVAVMSLKAAGVGINLTAASQVAFLSFLLL